MLILVGVVVLIGAVWWVYEQFTHVTVEDARVDADMISISSRVPGWITDVTVIGGDAVAKGRLLVSIDSQRSRLLVEEIDARLSTISTRRAELLARIRMVDHSTTSAIQAKAAALQASEAALLSAVAQKNLAQIDNQRNERLAPSGAVGRNELDKTRAILKTAMQQVRTDEANVAMARANLAQAQAGRDELNVLRQQLAGLDPEEKQLRAQRDRAWLDLQYHTITMPFDGVIDKTFVHPNEYVTPGQRLLLIHDPNAVRVEAHVKETEFRYFRPGKKVDITVDAIPGRTFEGEVERMGESATSEFALLPSPNPSGNFTKITQRLPIRIAVHQDDGLLKPGMMVEVEIRR